MDNFIIDKQNGNVAFNDKEHIYIDVVTKKRFISVTAIISKYHEHFNEEFWSNYKAYEELFPAEFKTIKSFLLKSKKVEFPQRFIKKLSKENREKLSLKAQEYKDKWEENKNLACERGTAYHLKQEQAAYEGTNHWVGKRLDSNKSYVCKKDYYAMDLENGIYPEYLISWSTEQDDIKLAGQIDLMIKDGNNIHLLDYKTNAKIDKTSFFDRSAGKNKKMLYPLNDYDDCNFWHYAMQLSTYAWMISKNHPEFKIKSLTILHCDHDGNETEYDIPYLKSEVELMIKHYQTVVFAENKRRELDELIENFVL